VSTQQPIGEHPVTAQQPSGYRQIGDNRFREVVGFCYEDLQVGVVIEHRPGRTITEMDNVLMSMLSMNDSPLHIDAAFGEQGSWGQPLVSSLVTLSIVAGMAARSTSGKAIANLGWERIQLPAPVFIGDTLYAESEITGKRLSESRPGQGIAHCRTTGRKSSDGVVLSFDRSFLVPTRATDPHRTAGY